MPIVPKIQRSIGLNPLPNTQAQMPQQGFEGMPKSQNAAIKLFEAERMRVDEARLNEERRTFFDDFEYPKVYDPENGATALRGRDAIGVGDKLGKDFDTFVAERTKGLSTEPQRQAYTQWAQARKQSLMRWSAGHEAAQTENYIENEYRAGLESSIERAAVDPAAAPLEAANIRRLVAQRAQDKGLGEDFTRQEIEKQESALHSGAIKTLLDRSQPEAAREYYNTNEMSIEPSVRRQIVPKIKEMELRSRAQKETDAIVGKNLSLSDALSKVGQIANADVKAEVSKRVRQFYDDQAKADKAMTDEAYQNAINLMDNNPGRSVRDVIPADDWMRFSIQERNAIESRYDKGVNDDRAWLDFMGMTEDALGEMSQREFEANFRSKFDESHQAKAETYWRAAREKKADPDKYSTLITPTAMIEDTWNSVAKLNKSEYLATFSKYKQEALDQIYHYQETALGGKRKASHDEMMGIIGRVATETLLATIDEGWFTRERQVSVGEVPAGTTIEGLEFVEPTIGEMPKITSDAEYNALPPGSMFMGPDGNTRRKP